MAVEIAGSTVGQVVNTDKTIVLDRKNLYRILPFGSGWLFLDEVAILPAEIMGRFAYYPWGNLRDHFSKRKGLPKIMPGILSPEIINQLVACLLGSEKFIESYPELKDKLFVLTDIIDFKFRKQVEVGDCLHITARVVQIRRGIITYSGEVVKKNNEFVAGGTLRAAAFDR